MTCIDFGAAPRRAPRVQPELLKKLSTYPKAFWGERIRRARRDGDMRKLRLMSDARLQDIGLRRMDVGERISDLGKIRPDLVGFLSR
jgi:uncharacterized protein YjiS (DUF1127 family)